MSRPPGATYESSAQGERPGQRDVGAPHTGRRGRIRSRAAARYNLEAEGYVVESVERGDEAELRLAENPPDLVILDWHAARRVGPRDLPQAASAGDDPHAARHHGDRARRGGRARPRPFGRRRRLRRQALLGPRTDGAGARSSRLGIGGEAKIADQRLGPRLLYVPLSRAGG